MGFDCVGAGGQRCCSKVLRCRLSPETSSTEPRIAAIWWRRPRERDTSVRMKILRAIKSLDMQNPRVARLIIDGASDIDVRLRRACISQLSAVLTGASLREAAGELARTETDPDLKRQLMALPSTLKWRELKKKRIDSSLNWTQLRMKTNILN